MAIDDCDDQTDATTRRDLDSLAHLGSTASIGLTIIQVERTEGEYERFRDGAWPLTAGLQPLHALRRRRYLAAKLEQAGKFGTNVYTRAITRLQALSLGRPRSLEQAWRRAVSMTGPCAGSK